jgi:Uma2 family endonuclease
MAVINLQTEQQRTTLRPVAIPAIPPLENGDVLDRDEFERRYNAMPEAIKAELIEGRVYMSSPVRYNNHGKPDRNLNTWLGVYSAFTPGTSGANNATIRMDDFNEPQPDGILILEERGQAIIGPDDYLEGAPELAIEVSASTATRDLREKLAAYRRNGVREYIVWSIYDRQLTWFILEAGEYIPLPQDSDGIFRSRVFPGLWLDVESLLNDEMAAVLTVLQQGLASEEHAAFIQKLSTAHK